MKQLTPYEVLATSDKQVESLGRGNGAILFRKKSEKSPIDVYYRYFRGKSPVTIRMGEFKKSRTAPGITLSECRRKALDLIILRKDIAPIDLKEHLEKEIKIALQKDEEEKKAAAIEASKGSFSDLINDYTQVLDKANKPSAGEVKRSLSKDVKDSHPVLSEKKARDIAAEDIRQILAPVYLRGSRVMGNRLRSYLLAAFSFGLETDLDPERESQKVYCLEYNPVAAIKTKRDAEKVGLRCLSHEEVRNLWVGIDNTYRVGPILAALIKLMLATAGQRPQQIIRCTWKDFDEIQETLTIIDSKGKGGRKVKRVIPLSKRACSILIEIKSISGEYTWPFSTTGKAPVQLSSIGKAISRYVEESKSTPFTPRDIRRTAKNLLVDASVDRERRNLLQGHGQTGVDTKHYDRHDHLPEKRAALGKYDRLLDRIVLSKPVEKIINIDLYSKAKISA